MTDKMFDIAKKKDDGRFAKLGMRDYCSTWFGIKNVNAKSVNYIVDTYLECIDDIEFDTWIMGTHKDSRPIILTRTDLECHFADLLSYSNELEAIINLFMYLYDQEFWIDEANDCIYCTEYTLKARHRLSYVGIAMEYEKLCTMHENELLTWEYIDSVVEILNEYGYDIKKDYKFKTFDLYETASNIEERLQEIFF